MDDRDEIDRHAVEYVHAFGVVPLHRREQERLDGALPPCEVGPADRATLRAVDLAPVRGRVWLPDPELAAPMEVPDGAWQGWEWPDGSSLLLSAERDTDLPMLPALTPGGPSSRRAVVGGRVMHVRRLGPADREYAGEGFAADVRGFLGERTHFLAQVFAPSGGRRDDLLAALLTLEATGAEARWGPRPDGTFGPSDDGA